MQIEIETDAIPAMPALSGPHALAWSYLLDAVFADAFHERLGALTIRVPAPSVADACELRKELTNRSPRGGTERGLAILSGRAPERLDAERLYLLSFGVLAPRSLRAWNPQPPHGSGWTRTASLGVFTLRAKLWGIPIRAASAMQRPDLTDHAMAAMRNDFAKRSSAPSFYRLDTWELA